MPHLKAAILIVEHDDATRELYARALGQHYRVFACCDDHEVLGLLRTQSICAVVLEPALPDERGWALLTTLKQASDTGAIPVILCSTLDERKRGMALGAAAYLVKPVLPPALLEALNRVIAPAR